MSRQDHAKRQAARATRDLQKMIRMVLEDEGDTERAGDWLKTIGDKDPVRGIELFREMLSYSRGKLQ